MVWCNAHPRVFVYTEIEYNQVAKTFWGEGSRLLGLEFTQQFIVATNYTWLSNVLSQDFRLAQIAGACGARFH